MTNPIPASHADLLTREKKVFAHLALVTKDGAPHVTPMWFDYDGEHVLFNTARNRVKDRVLKRKPKIAFSVQDPANPYRYLQVRGQVVSETEEGAYDSICDLAEKYQGRRAYAKREGEVRVIYKVRPESATTMG
ncbi:MAG: PPOX class F420-dependent oxidoreductase [Deltaproteobacteria bacterium]|nr:PPOX class F420-dependent oxidoreductase [Deltaproteobacteria bacterium]